MIGTFLAVNGTKKFIKNKAKEYDYNPEDITFTIRLNKSGEPRVAMYHKNTFITHVPPDDIISSFI